MAPDRRDPRQEVSAEHLAFRQSLGSELRLRSWRRARVPVAEAVLDDEESLGLSGSRRPGWKKTDMLPISGEE